MLALALLVVGCDGEDAGPAQADVKQQQVAASEAVQEAAEVQEPSTPARESASETEQSDDAGEADREGPSGPVEAQSEDAPLESRGGPIVPQARACDAHPLVAEAERAAAAAPAAQEDEAGRDAENEVIVDEEQLELITAATEAMAGWFSQLETLTLDATVVIDWDDRCTQLAVDTTIQIDPLASLSVGDYSPWFQLETGLPLAESDEAVQMQDYLYDARVYSTVSGLDGWGASRWHYPLDFDDGAIHQWFAVEPSEFASYGRDGDELSCAAYEGGGIAEDEYEGEAVWVVTCDNVIQSLLPFDGNFPDSYDEALLRMVRITISQDSGAPLVGEYDAAYTNRDGGTNWVSRKIMLTSWNEPVDLPRPEPLLEGDEFEELVEQFRVRASAPERLLFLVEGQLATEHDMPWASEISLRLDGGNIEEEPWVRVTRTPDTFNRTVSFAEKANGGGVWNERSRLHWNGDGFWISEREVDGEPVWTKSTPAAHGFGHTSLDELLAERALIDLGLFRELLSQAEMRGWDPSVNHADVSGRSYYEVWVDSGVLVPGDQLFDRIAALLEAALAKSGYDDLAVLRVETFGMRIWLPVWDLDELRLVGGGAFQTDGGNFELWISVGFDPSLPFLAVSGPSSD